LAWQIAGQEALAQEFDQIHPEHFLMALLKCAELPTEELREVAPDAGMESMLVSEIGALRDCLERLSMDTTAVRRQLRAAMGKGRRLRPDKYVHRSEVSRVIFGDAEDRARRAGSDVLTALYLLDALLAAPSKVASRVLGSALQGVACVHPETPLLDRYARDLSQMALQEGAERRAELKAACRAVALELTRACSEGILLVSDTESTARAVVLGAVAEVESAPGGRREPVRIRDVSALRPTGQGAPQTLQLLEKLFAEAEAAGGHALLLAGIEAAPAGIASDAWVMRVLDFMGRASVRCLCPVSPAAHASLLAHDETWRRRTRAIIIEPLAGAEVPSEL
jgi:nucleotide-binding universal stress UspA family protein